MFGLGKVLEVLGAFDITLRGLLKYVQWGTLTFVWHLMFLKC
jgi:hypothetical protein